MYKVLILALFVGAITGYVSFAKFPDIILPASPGGPSLVATGAQEVFRTHLLFSLFVGLALAVAPLSALIANGFSDHAAYTSLLILFLAVTFCVIIIEVVYLQNYFESVLSASNLASIDPSIEMSSIPYFKVPLASIVVSLALGLFIYAYKNMVK